MDDQEIIQTLEERGGSWSDLFLVGNPPAISRWSPQGNLYGLVIEDDALWRECTEFLKRQGARCFASPDDAKRAFASRSGVKI
jgi:hypothetical protein